MKTMNHNITRLVVRDVLYTMYPEIAFFKISPRRFSAKFSLEGYCLDVEIRQFSAKFFLEGYCLDVEIRHFSAKFSLEDIAWMTKSDTLG